MPQHMNRCVKPQLCSIKAVHSLNLRPCAPPAGQKLTRISEVSIGLAGGRAVRPVHGL